MKKKTNIYDSDDADRSKRLSFTRRNEPPVPSRKPKS